MRRWGLLLLTALGLPSARADEGQILKERLAGLYPHFGAAQLHEKIVEAKDPLQFLRSFVPYYYDLLREAPPASLASLAKVGGLMLGDAHPENFGSLILVDGRAILGMNDFDDGGFGPLVYDWLRFLTAVKLFPGQEAQPLTPLVSAYRRGLGEAGSSPGDGVDGFHSSTQEFLNKATTRGQEADPKLLESQERLLRDERSEELDSKSRALLLIGLRSLLGTTFELHDALLTRKLGGGSGGLRRYRVLLRDPSHAHPKRDQIILEFKELVRPGVFPVESTPLPAAERLEKILSLVMGPSRSALYAFQSFPGLCEATLMRPRWAGQRSFKQSQGSAKEWQARLEDEALLLGRLHGQSALHSYALGVEAIADAVFEKEAQILADQMRRAFEISRSL